MRNIAEKDIEARLVKSEMYVTFTLNREVFGISVMNVEELIGYTPATHIPNSENYLKGVINLRGKVVPVIDLRLKFRMTETAYNTSTVILIVNVENKPIGLIVDSVSDVANIPLEMINEYSKIDSGRKNHFIKYIANYNDELVLILDIDRFMDDIEIPAESEDSSEKEPHTDD